MNNQLKARRPIFVFVGTDKARVQKFRDLVERIKRDMITLSQDRFADIVHLKIPEGFWDSLTKKFQDKILNRKDEDDDVLFEMETLLSMKNEKS